MWPVVVLFRFWQSPVYKFIAQHEACELQVYDFDRSVQGA